MQSRALDERRQNHIGQIGRDAIWTAIRSFKCEFTIASIEMSTQQKVDTIRKYIAGLVAAGYLTQTNKAEHKAGQQKRYLLINDIGLERPYVDSAGNASRQYPGRDAMWRTIRILRDYDCVELAVNATTIAHKVTEDEAARYLRLLNNAGILSRKKNGNKRARYSLIASKNNGPLPPAIQRSQQVFDRNIGQVVWTEKKGSDE